jgi:hypothetical protein
MIADAGKVVETYNDEIEWRQYSARNENEQPGPAVEMVDLSTFPVEPAVSDLRAHLVGMAKAQMAMIMGERGLAAAIMRRRVEPEVEGE